MAFIPPIFLFTNSPRQEQKIQLEPVELDSIEKFCQIFSDVRARYNEHSDTEIVGSIFQSLVWHSSNAQNKFLNALEKDVSSNWSNPVPILSYLARVRCHAFKRSPHVLNSVEEFNTLYSSWPHYDNTIGLQLTANEILTTAVWNDAQHWCNFVRELQASRPSQSGTYSRDDPVIGAIISLNSTNPLVSEIAKGWLPRRPMLLHRPQPLKSADEFYNLLAVWPPLNWGVVDIRKQTLDILSRAHWHTESEFKELTAEIIKTRPGKNGDYALDDPITQGFLSAAKHIDHFPWDGKQLNVAQRTWQAVTQTRAGNDTDRTH